MSNLRRYFKNNDVAFITIVTYQRNPILIDNINILTDSIQIVRTKIDFDLISYVYLPDHLHLLVAPIGNNIVSIIQRIKMSFGNRFRIKNNLNSGRIWKNRYWDHIIRNRVDMNRHIDYIHYNPVKHGLVTRPFDWRYSSIYQYKNIYQDDWGVIDRIEFQGEYGE